MQIKICYHRKSLLQQPDSRSILYLRESCQHYLLWALSILHHLRCCYHLAKPGLFHLYLQLSLPRICSISAPLWSIRWPERYWSLHLRVDTLKESMTPANENAQDGTSRRIRTCRDHEIRVHVNKPSAIPDWGVESDSPHINTAVKKSRMQANFPGYAMTRDSQWRYIFQLDGGEGRPLNSFPCICRWQAVEWRK